VGSCFAFGQQIFSIEAIEMGDGCRTRQEDRIKRWLSWIWPIGGPSFWPSQVSWIACTVGSQANLGDMPRRGGAAHDQIGCVADSGRPLAFGCGRYLSAFSISLRGRGLSARRVRVGPAFGDMALLVRVICVLIVRTDAAI
jgi:hypothetical protein